MTTWIASPRFARLAKTVVGIFFFLLPWQTRWIIAQGASEYATVAVTVVEVIFWLLVASTVFARSLTTKQSRNDRTGLLHPFGVRKDGWLIFLFLLWSAASLLWSPDRTSGIVALVHLVEGALLFVILRSDDKLRELAVRAFIYGMVPAAALGIYQFLTQHIAGSTIFGIAPHDAWMAGTSVIETPLGRTLRAYGPFPHPNIFGGYLVVAIFLSLRAAAKQSRTIYLLPIFSTALIATFSRSAWLALAVGLVFWIVSSLRSSQRRTSLIFLSIFAPFIISFFLAPDLFRARLTSTGRLEVRSTVERTTSLRAGFDAFRSHPIIGSGLGSLRTSEPPHNFFLALAADLGLLGLALFLIASLRGVRRPALPAGRRSNLILLSLFALTLFDHYLWTLLPGVWLFWLVLTVRAD